MSSLFELKIKKGVTPPKVMQDACFLFKKPGFRLKIKYALRV